MEIKFFNNKKAGEMFEAGNASGFVMNSLVFTAYDIKDFLDFINARYMDTPEPLNQLVYCVIVKDDELLDKQNIFKWDLDALDDEYIFDTCHDAPELPIDCGLHYSIRDMVYAINNSGKHKDSIDNHTYKYGWLTFH